MRVKVYIPKLQYYNGTTSYETHTFAHPPLVIAPGSLPDVRPQQIGGFRFQDQGLPCQADGFQLSKNPREHPELWSSVGARSDAAHIGGRK